MRKGFLGLLLIFLSAPRLASAGLGQREDSVEQDRKAVAGVLRSASTHALYTVHEITNNQGSIREYIADGVVFGVAWKGVRHPDLSSLLGAYLDDFKTASARAPKLRGRRAVSRVQGEAVIVERGGHMRSVQGKAYAPSLLPAGVNASEIQ